MPSICPTITAETPEAYAKQINLVAPFAKRIHIDVADAKFTPRQLLPPAHLYVPKGIEADVHVMVAEPAAHLMTLISLQPHLVIVHAEALSPLAAIAQLQQVGIKAGVALLPSTKIRQVAELIRHADHALIFAGHLGYQGGTADMSQLGKVAEIRALKPGIEIAWDGGVNDVTAVELLAGGIDVLNVGGFIQNAADPAEAYRQLTAIAVSA